MTLKRTPEAIVARGDASVVLSNSPAWVHNSTGARYPWPTQGNDLCEFIASNDKSLNDSLFFSPESIAFNEITHFCKER